MGLGVSGQRVWTVTDPIIPTWIGAANNRPGDGGENLFVARRGGFCGGIDAKKSWKEKPEGEVGERGGFQLPIAPAIAAPDSSKLFLVS